MLSDQTTTTTWQTSMLISAGVGLHQPQTLAMKMETMASKINSKSKWTTKMAIISTSTKLNSISRMPSKSSKTVYYSLIMGKLIWWCKGIRHRRYLKTGRIAFRREKRRKLKMRLIIWMRKLICLIAWNHFHINKDIARTDYIMFLIIRFLILW